MKRYFYLLGILFCASAFSASEAPSGPAVGSIAPDFTVHNLVTGEDVTLSSQQGKVVILTFWASWCPPCKREIPILEGARRARREALFHHEDPSSLYGWPGWEDSCKSLRLR
jgi:thiol-disulfide isomerase/thioredoxin